MKGARVALMPLLLTAAAANTAWAADGKNKLAVTIEMDPSVPGSEGALWLGYLMARANYVTQHADDYTVDKPGRLPPAFDEEVAARAGAPGPALTRESLMVK